MRERLCARYIIFYAEYWHWTSWSIKIFQSFDLKSLHSHQCLFAVNKTKNMEFIKQSKKKKKKQIYETLNYQKMFNIVLHSHCGIFREPYLISRLVKKKKMHKLVVDMTFIGAWKKQQKKWLYKTSTVKKSWMHLPMLSLKNDVKFTIVFYP